MNKNNNRKIRMAQAQVIAHHGAMSEETYDALFERATNLAYRSFDDVTDDHIEGVYERLVFNHQRGLGFAGAVTLH